MCACHRLGYFTSRPALKLYLRTMTNVLNAARQMALAAPNTKRCTSTSYTETVCTDNLEAAVVVSTHHDALSGTEKQAVADDYQLRLAAGEAETRGMMTEALQTLSGLPDAVFCNSERGLNISFCPYTVAASTAAHGFHAVVYNPLGHRARQVVRVPVASSSLTVVRQTDGSQVHVQVQELTARERSLSQLYLLYGELNNTARVAAFTNNATHVAIFVADLPPVGYETYLITPNTTTTKVMDRSATAQQLKPAEPATAPSASSRTPPPSPPPTLQLTSGEAVLHSDYYEARFAGGTLASLRNLKTGVEANVTLELGFYVSSPGGCTPDLPPDAADVAAETAVRAAAAADNPALHHVQAGRHRREAYEDGVDLPPVLNKTAFPCDVQTSGAYIFRPKSPTVWPPACTDGLASCWRAPVLRIVKGEVVEEAHIAFADWATVVVRLVRGLPRVEVEYTVGPIPQNNPFGDVVTRLGKEVVLRYNSSLASESRFFADSNGREMIERRFNRRGPAYPDPYPISEPVAGNYYPVNMLLALEDRKANQSLAIAVDRSMGGSSLHNGSLELMVHRRLQLDDARGVSEALNETMCGCRNPVKLGEGEEVRLEVEFGVSCSTARLLFRQVLVSSAAF